jgi:hypothetical protein
MKCHIEGPVLDLNRAVTRVFDPPRDGVAVPRAPRQGLEDEGVECTLEQIETWLHFFPGRFPGRLDAESGGKVEAKVTRSGITKSGITNGGITRSGMTNGGNSEKRRELPS